MSSIVSQRPRDCLACRVISGGGLIGVGAYIAFHSKRVNNNFFKTTMILLAIGSAGLGTTRLLDLPPFRHMNSHNQRDRNENLNR